MGLTFSSGLTKKNLSYSGSDILKTSLLVYGNPVKKNKNLLSFWTRMSVWGSTMQIGLNLKEQECPTSRSPITRLHLRVFPPPPVKLSTAYIHFGGAIFIHSFIPSSLQSNIYAILPQTRLLLTWSIEIKRVIGYSKGHIKAGGETRGKELRIKKWNIGIVFDLKSKQRIELGLVSMG